MGRWRMRGLKTRVGRECSICRGGEVVQWRHTVVCSSTVEDLEKSEEGVTVLRQGGGAAPTVRAAKSSEFGEGKL